MDIRYQTPGMAELWAPQTRNRLERQLWIDIMGAQAAAGVPIPEEHIVHYIEAARDISDSHDELVQIALIERRTGHDLYARMQYFNSMAGHEDIHLGLTSSDITENVQQTQISASAELLMAHGDQVLRRLVQLALAERMRPMVARTHGQPAQATTLGKRVLDWANELTMALDVLRRAVESRSPRGLVGAVGTRADLAALLHRHRPDPDEDGALARAQDLDLSLIPWKAHEIEPMGSVGQCYPRSSDLPVVSAVVQVVSACNTVATNIRLLAVLGHANESRTPTQVGSSAMPHKTNPRYSERVHSLTVVVRGYASMLEQLSGGMWFEGDVSTSAGRRVALPGLFHVADSVLAATATALDRLEFNREAIAEDVRRHRPLLATGLLLEACISKGMARDAAHRLIKDHVDAVMAAGISHALVGRMADDPEVPLSFGEIETLLDLPGLAEPAAFIVHSMLEGLTPDEVETDGSWPGPLL